MAERDNHDQDPTRGDRRQFLKTAVVAAGAALCPWAAAGCTAKIPPGLFAAGTPGQFPIHTMPRQVQNTHIYVVHWEQGYAAISGECPHNSCPVEPVEGGGFACGCHGSAFAADGTVTEGPADRDLTWFEVLIADGELLIDPSVPVPKGTFYTG